MRILIKAKVVKPFYCAKGKELYLDEDRFKELAEQGYVEKIKEIKKAVGRNIEIEKATNDKARILSK